MNYKNNHLGKAQHNFGIIYTEKKSRFLLKNITLFDNLEICSLCFIQNIKIKQQYNTTNFAYYSCIRFHATIHLKQNTLCLSAYPHN